MAENEDMDNLIARTQMQALQSQPQPSFGGLTAPQDPGQIQALLQKLQAEQIAQRYASYGPGMADIARSAQTLGGGIQQALGPQGPSPQQQQAQNIRGALMSARAQYSDLVNNQGVDPDQANLTVLKSLVQAGIPGADSELAKAQTTILSNKDKVSSSTRNDAQAAAASDEISNRKIQNDRNNAKDTWTTINQTPGGAVVQKNGLGEVRVQQTQNASAAAAAAVSPDAMDAMVNSYIANGGVVPSGVGRSPALASKFWAAVQNNPNASDAQKLVAAKLGIKSTGEALGQTQKQLSQTTSYFDTMDKNIGAASALADKLNLSDQPTLNRAVAAWEKGTSDPEFATYRVFFDSVANEYAKIKSGALGNAPVSDSARKEAQDILIPLMGAGGVKAAFEAVKQEGQNRLGSLASQRNDLINSLQGKGGPAAQATPVQAPAGGAVVDFSSLK